MILVNSNPATIMTDPEFADRTYIEPITPEVVEKIIEREKPGRAAADARRADGAELRDGACRAGVLEKHGVKMIGANAAAIHKGEDRAGVQGRDDQDRARYAAVGHGAHDGGGARGGGGNRDDAADHPAGVHARRERRRDRLQPRGVRDDRGARARSCRR